MVSLISSPAETVGFIASFLEPQDVANFSQTCHFLCNATASTLFARVYLCPAVGRNYPQHIAEDVADLMVTLLRRQALRCVRSLRVTGVRQWTARAQGRILEYDTSTDYQGWSTGINSKELETYKNVTRQQAVAATYALDPKWIPLAQLLTMLPRLEDFIYAHPRCQFSPCLLAALSPQCRLHLETFSLRSLYQSRRPTVLGSSWRIDPGSTFEVDPYELELATSPNLSSILYIDGWCKYADVNYNTEAIRRLIADGLTPNLKRVHILSDSCTVSSIEEIEGLLDQRLPPYVPWPYKTIGIPNMASLEDVCMESGAMNEAPHMYKNGWLSSIPSTLTTLEVVFKYQELGILQVLSKYALPALENLTLSARGYTVDQYDWDREGKAQALEWVATARELICSLLPLKRLWISSDFCLLGSVPVYREVLHFHGTQLRSLHLPGMNDPTKMTPSVIRSIGKACPGLHTLQICLPRSEGSCDEVALYTALGGIPRLHNLTIELQNFQTSIVSEPTWFEQLPMIHAVFEPDATFEEICKEKSLPKGYGSFHDIRRMIDARAAILNAAIDQHLIEAIFRHIVRTQRLLHPDPSLDRLDIELFSQPMPYQYGFSQIEDLSLAVGPPWRCVRSQDPNGDDQLESFRVGRRCDPFYEPMDWPILFVLLTVWPDIPVENWRDSWRSLPLCRGGHHHPSHGQSAAMCDASTISRDFLAAFVRAREMRSTLDLERPKFFERAPRWFRGESGYDVYGIPESRSDYRRDPPGDEDE